MALEVPLGVTIRSSSLSKMILPDARICKRAGPHMNRVSKDNSLPPEAAARSRLPYDHLFGGKGHNLLDRPMNVERALKRAYDLHRTVLAHICRHALGLKIELFVQPRGPVTLDDQVGLGETLFYVSGFCPVLVDNVVLSPDDSFPSRASSTASTGFSGSMSASSNSWLFEGDLIRCRYKCDRLGKIVDLLFGKCRIVGPDDRNEVLSGISSQVTTVTLTSRRKATSLSPSVCLWRPSI